MQRASREFLRLPTMVMAGFVVLAVVVVWLDQTAPAWIAPIRNLIGTYLFRQASATNAFLGMATTGLITMTSITFSMLLLALQQSASLVGAQVVYSFLLRRRNQIVLGGFLGLTLFVLIVHATAHEQFNPLLGALLSLLLIMLALYGLALLIYMAVNQMRPQTVLDEVRTRTLESREQQRELLLASYREPRYFGGVEERVQTEQHGYVRSIDLKALRQALHRQQGEVEVEICLEVGDYVAYGEEVALVRAEVPKEAERLARVVKDAMQLDFQRATSRDPSFGIQQILMIGWSSGSTAYQNPGVAIEAIRSLRDIIGRWVEDYDEVEGSGGTLPLVYPDGLVESALNAMGELGVVSTESLQAITFEEAMKGYRHVFPRLPQHLQERVALLLSRLVTGAGDHVLTPSLETSMADLAQILRQAGYAETAAVLETAREQMASISGILNARSTRAQQASPHPSRH